MRQSNWKTLEGNPRVSPKSPGNWYYPCVARLPDRFDLQVRKARSCTDPVRQVDYVLGALAGLKEWHFLNLGTKDAPQAAKTQIDTDPYLLVYSDASRIEEFVQERGGSPSGGPLPLITVATEVAMAWCVECQVGLFVNPPEDAVMIPFAQLKNFHSEWTRRGGRQASGFWIPNMTTEEEDFWQEQGL
jgi:hypothetical protein